jgi:hypothetical protein
VIVPLKPFMLSVAMPPDTVEFTTTLLAAMALSTP